MYRPSRGRAGSAFHRPSGKEPVRHAADTGGAERRSVTVRFLKEGLEFPPEGQANPMQTLQLQLLGAFAEFERSVIRERQREGIEIARRKGEKFGHGSALTPAKEAEIRQLREQGLSTRAIGERIGCSHASVQRTLKQPVAEEPV